MRKLLLFCIILIAAAGCKKNEDSDDTIDSYLTAEISGHNWTAEDTNVITRQQNGKETTIISAQSTVPMEDGRRYFFYMSFIGAPKAGVYNNAQLSGHVYENTGGDFTVLNDGGGKIQITKVTKTFVEGKFSFKVISGWGEPITIENGRFKSMIREAENWTL